MAGARELRSRLNEEFLTCQICIGIYNDPITLHCQHSFCRQCVGQCLASSSGSLHCPICRQKTSLPKRNGIASLKKNFFLQNLIDTLNERRSSQLSITSSETLFQSSFDLNGTVVSNDGATGNNGRKIARPPCDNCDVEKSLAVARCLDCTDNLCRDCEVVHCQTKFTKKHKVVRLKDIINGKYKNEIQERAKVFCPQHPEEICKSICANCYVPACQDCLALEHKDHVEKDIKVAVAFEKERALKLMESAETAKSNAQVELEAKRAEVAKSKTLKLAALAEIQHRTKAIVAAAKSHEDKLSTLIKTLSKRKKEAFSNFEEQRNVILTQLENRRNALKSKCGDALSFGTPTDILALHSVSDGVEDVLLQLQTERNDGHLILSDEWKLLPDVTANDSSSFVLERIKSMLKNLIGHVEYKGKSLNPHDTFSDSSDEEVIVIKNSDNDVYASSSSSPASTGFSTTHNEVAHCPKALVNSVGHSTLAVADSNNAYCEIKPLEKDSSSNEKTADSSSLSLMRKYPPGCTFLNGKTALGRDETDARKNADSDTSECSTSRGKLVWKKSDAASKRTTITNWKASRSKSAGRQLDEGNDPFYSTPHRHGCHKTDASSSPTIAPNYCRGRTRRRSLPGNPTISTMKALASPSGEASRLMHLSTSPVAALAENPARLGLYDVPDPTSNAAVASLTQAIAFAPPADVINRSMTYGGEGHTPFASQLPMGSDDHLFVKSFQSGGKLITFRSAPKLSASPGGHIIATDYKAQRVFAFSSAGNAVNSLKTKATGCKNLHPISAAVTRKGKLLVASGDAVYKFSANGKLTKKLASGCFRKCCGIATDLNSGKMVITDIEKRVVTVHNEEGVLELTFSGCEYPKQMRVHGSSHFASNLEESLQLKTPYFVAVDPNTANIVVSDWANNDIKIFNPDGLCISCLCCCNPTPFADKSPFSPPPADTFRNPAGVCCDSESNLFVADHGRHRVAMFDSNWQFQRFIATGANGLQNPWSVAADSNRQLYVSEYWSRAIKTFSY